MYQIKETVLQDNTNPKYLEKVMGGSHRWGHLYSSFQGIFPARGGTHGCGQFAWKKARKKCAAKTETAHLKSTKGKLGTPAEIWVFIRVRMWQARILRCLYDLLTASSFQSWRSKPKTLLCQITVDTVDHCGNRQYGKMLYTKRAHLWEHTTRTECTYPEPLFSSRHVVFKSRVALVTRMWAPRQRK